MKRLLFCFLCTAAFCATASAHIRDEYLQAALITLAPEGVRIELRLTPGVELADRVFAVIDTDHSGQLSSSEEQSYARRVVQDVSLELDGQHIPLALINIRFPSHPDMKDGTAAIQLDLSANAALNSPRDHQLSFRNNHLPKLSVYQANVLIPGNDAIEVTEQQRDIQQQEFKIRFRVSHGTISSNASSSAATATRAFGIGGLVSVVLLSIVIFIFVLFRGSRFRMRKERC
jgi:hypothetical protein